jgi:hypothetical protein
MNKVKKDAIDVKFTLIGMAYGVLVVAIYWELNLEEQN